MRQKLAVYPGSFDPVTYGHLDVIERALEIFSPLIVAVVDNPNKQPLFSVSERVAMLEEIGSNYPGQLIVEEFKGLLVDFLRRERASFIVRGLRAVSDFELEFMMATMNRKLAPEIDTIFLMTNEEHFYLSSSSVKEVAKLGGNVEGFVPPVVEKKLKEKYGMMPGEVTVQPLE
ncbi:MAG: pantetheine-phosphate adenylyltransferase [bacterium]|nr:pantetheine-phosphate adenylyltransferase [bacterium]